MAKLTISAAARACRVARSTLQRAIHTGRLSLDPDHRVDTAELLRAGYMLHAARQEDDRRMRHEALQDAAEATPPDATLMQQAIAALERENTLLHAALDAAAAREQEARANTQAAREERALLLQMLQQMQHRYDRLLDAPRSPLPPRPSPGRAPPVAHPAGPLGDSRGVMRRRIVTLLQAHPEGLTPAEMQTLLGVDRSLADTCLGMLRYGLVHRVERGRYVAAATAQG
jgi:hypothetical protein